MDPRTILLVHSDLDVRRVFRAALEHAGYQVVDTWDGDDALLLLARHHCSIAVTDLFIDGRDTEHCFVRRLRADPHGATPPVLVVTAWASETYRELAAREGATEFLPLPIRPGDLVARVNRYARDLL